MDVPEIKPIQLNPEEADLRRQMESELTSGGIYSGNAALHLMRSLLARKVIPEIRVRNFIDPYPGGRGKSHRDVFEGNGCRGEDIFRHPNFVRFIKYFIDGPALPAQTVERFRRILIDDFGTSGMLMEKICKFTRAETRKLRLDKYTAREEFWRLARELEYPHAAIVRDAVGATGTQ